MAKKTARKSGGMVYYFGKTRTDGDGSMKTLIGGKGANLAEMTSIGLPVPAGFTITTECCALYNKAGGKLPKGLMTEVADVVKTLEKETGKKFGDASNPLLVSVRSGAAVSMPGMMNTILNLGLNDKSVAGLANATGNERFRVRRLPPADQHVRRRGDGEDPPRVLRGGLQQDQDEVQACRRTPTFRPRA